jgi:hypothetical protein
MQADNKERWLELCEQAVKEPDSVRFRELIGEINDLLDDNDEQVGEQLQPGSLLESSSSN